MARLEAKFLVLIIMFMPIVSTTFGASVAAVMPTASPATDAGNDMVDKTIPIGETKLSSDDFDNAKKLRNNRPQPTSVKGMQNGKRFEGDIANPGLTADNVEQFVTGGRASNGVVRNAIRGGYSRWPGSTIPYTISTQYSANARAVIARAMQAFTGLSCIRFVPRTTQQDYIFITADDGCYSYIGRNGGQQIVSLDSDCLVDGVVMHELMHAVGFFHEQSRPDRDQYVTILYQNIIPGFEDQFAKVRTTQVDYLGVPYDYNSVMHYEARTFSRNGQPTIQPKQAGVQLRLRNQFSQIDVRELNTIGNCAGRRRRKAARFLEAVHKKSAADNEA